MESESWTYDQYNRVVTHVDFNGDTARELYGNSPQWGGQQGNNPGALIAEYRYAPGTFPGVTAAGTWPSTTAWTERTEYLYDAAGNRATVTHTHRTPNGPGSAGADYVITDRYDGDGRLVSEAKDVGGTADTADDTYTAYGYTGTDQWTQTVHQGLTAAGSVTQTTTYTYDAAGQMTGVSITDTATSTTTSVNYAYDANGVRVERTQGGVTTVYLVDPDNATGYTQVLEQGVDTNNDHRLDAAEVQQAFTIGTRVLAQATATQVLKLLTDAHGSTRAVLNAGAATLNAAAVLQNYVYSAFGSDLGLAPSPLTAMRYAGQMIDPVTGLSYNRARWYDPSTGRFTQSDTYGGDQQNPITLNKYLYGDGNPVTQSDPSGEFSIAEELAVIGELSGKNLQQNYQRVKVLAGIGRDLVRLAFGEMLALSSRVNLTKVQRGIQFLYYTYEEFEFEGHHRDKGVKSLKQDGELLGDLPKLVNYVAALPGAAEELDEMGIEASPLKFLKIAKGVQRKTVFIPLTGSRVGDNFLSYAVYAGLRIRPIINAALKGDDWITGAISAAQELAKAEFDGISDGGAITGATWHHNEILGVMQLLKSKNHRFSHVGGGLFWDLLHGKNNYRGKQD